MTSALQSAAAAQAAGFFDGKVVAISVSGRKQDGTLNVSQDEHPLPNTSTEALARLKPISRQPCCSTWRQA